MLKSTWSRKYKMITASLMAAVIALIVLAPPIEPELANLNIQKNQDVITDTYTLQADIKRTIESVKINDEDVNPKDSKLDKEIKLQPGNNEVKLVATAKIDDVQRELINETYNIYFDYEAMLYAEQLEKEQQEAEEVKKKLESVPHYEIVRKEGIQDGFSAVMYVDGPIEDYLLTNAIKDFKSQNTDKNISVLVFDKAEKEHVEKDMESEDPSGLVPHVRANFEKRENNEQFFLFPAGLDGSKLAVEV